MEEQEGLTLISQEDKREYVLTQVMLPQGLDLAGVLRMKYRRRIASDNTVACPGKTLQVQASARRASYALAWVDAKHEWLRSPAWRPTSTMVACSHLLHSLPWDALITR